jgi:hypothetical protein
MTTDAGLKHLDFLQGAINRMAGHCFAIKGWSITVTTAMVAAGAKETHVFFAVAVLPVLLFWGLDSYFLVIERRFRRLFVDAGAAVIAGGPATFAMSPGKIRAGDVARMMARPALLAVHGTLLAALAACIAILGL